MNASRTLLAIALAASPCACVIDGVPLPDETQDTSDNTTANPDLPAEVSQGLYATMASGVTVVFGVPGVVQANATAVALSGSVQAQAPTADDGSFSIALIGAISDTIEIRILVKSQEVDHAVITAPHAALAIEPDGSPVTNTTPPATKPATSSARVDTETVHLDFPAGSFAADASVAIVNIDHSSTETASAGPDGSLKTDVSARRGDTLYVMAITSASATAPYVITAPQ